MRVEQINNVAFGAKLFPATSGGAKNEKLLKFFEQKTQNCKNYSLLQDKLNFNGKDTFYLLNENGKKVMSTRACHSCYSYSCVEEMADRFVEIFNFLAKDVI